MIFFEKFVKHYYFLNSVIFFVFFCLSTCKLFSKERVILDQAKIAYLSTWKIKCGIAMYMEHIYKSQKKQGLNVYIYSYDMPIDKIYLSIKNNNITHFHIQYEPALILNAKDFLFLLKKLKSLNIKIIFTIHCETLDLKNFETFVDKFIFHKEPIFEYDKEKILLLPMGVPVYDYRLSKKQLRQKFNFSAKQIILSTVGFLSPFKMHSEVLRALIPWLKSDGNHHIQLLASINDNSYDIAVQEHFKIDNVIKKNNIQKQVTYIARYLDQKELTQRLALSDLGYLWAKTDSKSSSAAAKEFIAARLPFIVNNSSHYHDIKFGVVKVDKNLTSLVKAIEDLLSDKNKIYNLKNELEYTYNQLNYDVIVEEFNKAYI